MTNKLKQFAIGVSTLSLWALSTPAFAQDFPTQKVLPLELSTQAAMAAIKKCHDDGFKVSVAILDQSGLRKVQLKADVLDRPDGLGIVLFGHALLLEPVSEVTLALDPVQVAVRALSVRIDSEVCAPHLRREPLAQHWQCVGPGGFGISLRSSGQE